MLCSAPLFEGIIPAVWVGRILLGSISGMTSNLAHAQGTLFGLVPLVIQLQDFILTKYSDMAFTIRCTHMVTDLPNNQDLLINICRKSLVEESIFQGGLSSCGVLDHLLQRGFRCCLNLT